VIKIVWKRRLKLGQPKFKKFLKGDIVLALWAIEDLRLFLE